MNHGKGEQNPVGRQNKEMNGTCDWPLKTGS